MMSRPATRQTRSLMVRIFALLALVAITAIAATASATVMKYLNLVQLVEKSDVIVHGKIAGKAYVHDESRNQVMTHWTLDISKSYLGDHKKSVTFVQWGGMDGEFMHAIPGDAALKAGEEVVLFLNEDKGTLYLTALSQSKYKVIREGNDVNVLRDLTSISFVPDGELPSPIHGKIEKNGFASFEAELESLVAAIKGGAR